MLALVKEMPVKAVAELVGEHDTRIWRVLHHYVSRAREAEDFSCVRQVGIDETSSKRGHNYITLAVDLERSKVLFATEGRDSGTLAAFRADLEAHGAHADQIEEMTLDISPAFIKGVNEQFPKAELTFDKFHVMKIINEAVDEVRRAEQKERPELLRSRWVWLKNENHWTSKQRQMFEALSLPMLNLKTARAHRIKLALQEFWTLPAGLAEPFLKRWYFWATRSRLESVIKAARTVKRHWNGILRYFVSRITNGVLEGINSLIQAAKARARGYRSTRNLITMVYLISGKLQLPSPI